MTTATTTTQKKENIILIHEKDTQGPIEELFHSYTTIKVIEFLLAHKDYDYSKKDISKNSYVSFRHVLKAIKILEEAQLIKKTRNIGRAHMYKYNTDNETAKKLYTLWLNLACDRCEREAAKQKPDDPITLIIN
jgi:DNA-binding MarR family transcriptional regulator